MTREEKIGRLLLYCRSVPESNCMEDGKCPIELTTKESATCKNFELRSDEELDAGLQAIGLNLDALDHPGHYNREGAMECIEEMLLIFGPEETMSFCKLNAWKYRYRAADKGGLDDLEKSDRYLAKYKELKERTK